MKKVSIIKLKFKNSIIIPQSQKLISDLPNYTQKVILLCKVKIYFKYEYYRF